MNRFSYIALLIAVTCLGCAKRAPAPEPSGDARVSGTINLSGTWAPAAAAQLEITLSDVSAEDGAVAVAQHVSAAPAHFPTEYALPYDSGAIRASHRYTVSARILEQGRPRWATDTAYAVITQGNPTRMDIQLAKTGELGDAVVSANTASSVVAAQLPDTKGAIPYRAYFSGTQLVRLDEERASTHIAYEFTGARLRSYAGVNGSVRLRIEFDERGKLLRATKQDNGTAMTVDPTEIDDARNRAALLRSHALAQREIQAHAPH